MRSVLLPLVLLICLSPATAQQNLSGSRHRSLFTYVYRVKAKEYNELVGSHRNVSGKYLHTLSDSFETNEPVLLPGNYIFSYARENRLVFELKTVGDVQYELINNNRDLVVALHNRIGENIPDAKVSVRNKKMQYDPLSQTYRLNKYQKAGLIRVYHKDVLYVFRVNKRKNRYYHQKTWAKIVYGFPLKYVSLPIRKLLHPVDRYPDFFHSTEYEKKFNGFMVFSKPKYKPGDTVRFKAFITHKKGKLVHEQLILRLTDRDLTTDTIIANLKPYRKGAYDYEFVLSDKLDLDLDDEYLLTLEERRSKKYDLNNYDGDLDEEEYAAKRKVVMRGKFEYEEYELASSRFEARTDLKEHNRGQEVSLFLKATDENDLAIMDGRVKILVRPSYANQFYASHVFIPDTLWYHEQDLDALGETKIILPDSIFPAASFEYQVVCEFLNSNNELQSKTIRQSFRGAARDLVFRLKDDSLQIEELSQGRSVSSRAIIYAIAKSLDTISQQPVNLPASIRINPFSYSYFVKSDSTSAPYKFNSNERYLSANAARTKDSIEVQLVNPSHLPVWYTIFAGKKLIHRGFGDSLLFRDKTKTSKNYFVSLQYLFGGQIYNEDYTVPFKDKLLRVQVTAPQFIYPGQSSEISIDVKDVYGKPVANADITAFAITKKFANYREPFVPYLGKYYRERKRYGNFNAQSLDDISKEIKLNWQRWSREMKLDTIEYYKFLHPQSVYINVEPAQDTITQVAPFVVKDGVMLPVHQIYIDEIPVYFSQSQQLQRYSFRVSPGKHSFKLRTSNSMIFIDSFWISKGVKNFFSVNADTGNKRIRIQKLPDTLTKYEQGLWARYMILIENNFGENFAYLKQDRDIFLLNRFPGYQNVKLAGPLPNQYASLHVKNRFIQDFEAEGNYRYQISQGLIKQKEIHQPYLFRSFLPAYIPQYDFHDFVLTEKEIDSLWQDYLDHRSVSEELFRNPILNKENNGQLRIGINPNDSAGRLIKNILLFRYDDPDFLRVYRGGTRDFGYLNPGEYRIFFLMLGDNYFIRENIMIRQNGINYYETGKIIPLKRDSVSIRISDVIMHRDRFYQYSQDADMQRMKESFNEKYLDQSGFTENISGTITDEKGTPIPFAAIWIKGTNIAVSSDNSGRFQMRAPAGAVLVVSAVGFTSQEMRLNNAFDYSVSLMEASNKLEEVVVVGYGTARKRELTGSVSSIPNTALAGKIAGVVVNGDPASIIRIRGIASVSGNAEPLYIIDGLPADRSAFEKLQEGELLSASILTPEEALAIYGAAAANGVVIITTKRPGLRTTATASEEMPFQGNQLRKNFRDDAFWKPRLKSDANGKASFKLVFPDDITNWRTFVIAMGQKKQSGYAEGTIKSFKTVSANLALPQFATEGDTINLVAKSLNYLPDSVNLRRSFYLNDELVKDTRINFLNSWIDTFLVITTARDSIKLKYTIEKDNGYFDGEERNIPVFKQGVLESTGLFVPLNKDTSFSLQLHPDTGTIKMHAEASLFPVFEDEIERIRNYEYLCNEQLASKLKALLVQKRIDGFLKKEFKGDKNIKELIERLNKNKVQAGLWGWWEQSSPSIWISLHVMEALTRAEAMGYPTSLNKKLLTDYLVYNLESYRGAEKIASLNLLQLMEAKIDYRKYIDSIEKHGDSLSMYEKLRLAELKQRTGIVVSIDTMIAKQRQTMFGNIYWGDESYKFFDNSIQNTLLMYRVLRKEGSHEDLLQKVRNYFLEKRRSAEWRNTYESSLILETILPDLMIKDSMPRAAELVVSGDTSYTIKKFPFSGEIKNGAKLQIHKTGDLPVYFTAWQEHWNRSPEKHKGEFEVESVFERDGKITSKLKAGVPVLLKIHVTVKGDADYVMIEAPIPAACSYKNKNQPYQNNEVHREYFKNKVSIFCSNLKKGNYTFTISLLPRYTGRYQLNPAKAELMYFPVLYGREGMKRVSVE